MDVLLVGNDQTIKVLGLQDEISEAYLNSATVTATVKTRAGVEVEGASWPLTLDYVADSDGDYRGTLDDAIELTAERNYIIEIRADAGGGLKAFWRFIRPAQYRQP